MDRLSRRQALAAAGSALFAGCSSLLERDDGRTITPYDVPTDVQRTEFCDENCPTSVTVLGRDAVPEGVSGPPRPQNERSYDAEVGARILGVVEDGRRLTALWSARSAGQFSAPELVTLDTDGTIVARTSLTEVPSNRPAVFGQVNGTVVVGGHTADPSARTWLRGFRDDEAVAAYESAMRLESFTTVAGDLVAVGDRSTVDQSGDGDAVVVRFRLDGTNVWERVAASASSLQAVTRTGTGVVAGGSAEEDAFLVAYDSTGRQRWERRLRVGLESYAIEAVESGGGQVYGLARSTNRSNNHVLLVALRTDGTVRWARVFDPDHEREPPAVPSDIFPAGIVVDDGPVLAGLTGDRGAWTASLDPEGAVEYAGYWRYEDRPTRPRGISLVWDSVLVYGNVGSRSGESRIERPWFARF